MPFKKLAPLLKTSLCAAAVLGTMCFSPALYAASVEENIDDSAMQPAQEPIQPEAEDAAVAPVDVWDRVRRGYKMPTLESAKVDKWVRHYQRNPAYLNRMFERSGRYLYHILEEVEDRGMPTELALLPFVESAFQPEALSRAKAAGLWQFMPRTGTQYSLEQNLWRDDRRDVLESTRAALDYFQYLYGMFNDWHLALAAYNWGEGSVQRAIRRQKNRHRPTDYLHLSMPNETANYVPKLEAIKRMVSEPEKYGLKMPDVGNEPFFVTITKPTDIDTKTAAELAGMSLEDFKLLNPSFKLPVIVAAHNNVMLLPADRVDDFIDNLVSWMDSGQPLSRWTTYKLQNGETLAAVAERTGMTEHDLREVNGIPKGRKVLANSTLLVRANADEQGDISEADADAKLRLSPLTTWRRVNYRVRSGDTISGIARRWHITQRSIIKNNRLRSSRLRVGQRLILTVPNVERAPIRYVQPSSGTRHRIHAVRRGETLSTIAQRYGVSTDALRQMNRISGSNIRAGQRLRVPLAGRDYEEDVVGNVYTVVAGDTLSGIAARHGVSVTRLKRANRMTRNTLKIGQRLEVPAAVRTEEVRHATASSASSTGVHRVRQGDSLYEIGRRYGVSVKSLKAANGLRGNNLRIGQKLVIPATAKKQPKRQAEHEANLYRVRSGDTLYEIALKHKTSVKKLKELNGLRSNTLRVGQTLRLP